MTYEEFAQGIDKLLSAYPTWSIKYDDRKAMQVWYEFFENLTEEEFKQIVKDYIKTEQYNPTIAGLLSKRIIETPVTNIEEIMKR